jgi:plastocyanin domain-containing protein
MRKTIVLLVTIAVVVIGLILAGCTASTTQSSPETQNLSLRMGEGKIIQEVGEEDAITGEFHRWEPSVLVVNKGDLVVLTVENPRSKYHGFALPEFGVATPKLEPRGGTATVTFTADKAGTFQFVCSTPFSREGDATDCNLDHERQVGYLIVLE